MCLCVFDGRRKGEENTKPKNEIASALTAIIDRKIV